MPSSTESISIRELQDAIDAWISQFEAGYWPPLANLARLSEEVGELSRELNHHFGPKKKKSSEDDGDIAGELGDIIFTVVTIANSLNINLTDAVRANLDKVAARDTTRWKRADTSPSENGTPD